MVGDVPADHLENLGVEWDRDLLGQENVRAEVSGLEDDKVRADAGILPVTGLSECLGALFYDSSSERGYAAHVTTPAKTPQDLARFLADFNALLIEDGIDYDHSKALVAGINYGEEIGDRFIADEMELEKVISQGAKRGIAQEYVETYFTDSEVRWDAETGMTSAIFLDVDEGLLSYSPGYEER